MKQLFFFFSLLAFAAIANAQANITLSNLASPTKINQTLLPGGTTGKKDIGSNDKRWRNGYFNATVYGYGVGSNYGVYGEGYYGVYGSGTTYGVYGKTSSGWGVVGISNNIGIYGTGNSYGMYGLGGAYGIYGYGTDYGVYGETTNGYGVAGSSANNYGLYGSSVNSWGSVATGVFGAYGSGTTGYGVQGSSNSNYGVYGSSYNSYGGYFYSSNSYGIRVATGIASGFYAGVFDGSVYTFGTYQPSDANFKKNVQEFSDAMAIINKLRPVNYEYKSDGNFASLNLPKGNHYGLIAQELEKVLPNLVQDAPPLQLNKTHDQVITSDNLQSNGKARQPNEVVQQKDAKEVINSKAVNYTELIPVMIKAIQELSKQNDDLKIQVAALTQTVSQLTKSNGTVILSSASINQNFPNPFTKSTVISFNVPQGSSANVVISQTGSGNVIKTIPLSAGTSQLTFEGASLAAGSYSYSLYIDGKKIDTKQMIISR